jgi:hypothetical protein
MWELTSKKRWEVMGKGLRCDKAYIMQGFPWQTVECGLYWGYWGAIEGY